MNSIIYQFLNEPRRIRQKLVEVDAKIEDLRTAMLPGAIRYDKDNVMVSPEDHMIDYVIRVEPLMRDRNKLLTEYRRADEEVRSVLSILPERKAEILRLKYYDGMSNGEIADRFGITKRRAMQLCDESYDQILSRVLTSPLKYAML